MGEQIVGMAKAYAINKDQTIVLVVPKTAREKLGREMNGEKVLVKVDEKGRLIYELLGTTQK